MDLQQLIDEVADDGRTLSSSMLKAKVLASRLRGRKFKRWVDLELGGYKNIEELPDYRCVPCSLLGDYVGPYAKFTRVSVGIPNHLEGDHRRFCEQFDLHERLKMLEEYEGTPEVREQLDIAVTTYFSQGLPRYRGTNLVSLARVLGVGEITGVLSEIRTRLLDFLLEIQTKTSDGDVSSISQSEVDDSVGSSIYHGCTFNQSSFGESHMGDQINAKGQIAAIGSGANATDNSMTQIWNQNSESIPLGQLAAELSQLIVALESGHRSPERELDLGATRAAKVAAESDDGEATLNYLQRLKNLQPFVQDLGTSLLANAITIACQGM